VIERVKNQVSNEIPDFYENLVNELVQEGIDLQQLAGSLLKMYAGIDNFSEKGEDIQAESIKSESGNKFSNRDKERERDREGRGGKSRSRHLQNSQMVRLFMNLGKKQKIGKGDILGAISGETGIKSAKIGVIDMYDKFSFVEVSKEEVDKVIRVMSKSTIKGKKVNFEIAGA